MRSQPEIRIESVWKGFLLRLFLQCVTLLIPAGTSTDNEQAKELSMKSLLLIGTLVAVCLCNEKDQRVYYWSSA